MSVLDPDIHAALPCGDRGVERLGATRVHAIDVRTGQLRERAKMLHAFRLDARWTAFVMPLGSRHASGEQFARALGDERFVFAMRGDDNAEFARQLERPIKLRVIDARMRPCKRGTL
jgi:hypothetical protein